MGRFNPFRPNKLDGLLPKSNSQRSKKRSGSFFPRRAHDGERTPPVDPNTISGTSKYIIDAAGAREDGQGVQSVDTVADTRISVCAESSAGAHTKDNTHARIDVDVGVGVDNDAHPDNGADQISTSSRQRPVMESSLKADVQDTPESIIQTPDTSEAESPTEREQAALLWDVAYGSLREQFPDLLDRYEAIVTEYMTRKAAGSNPQTKDLSNMDPQARRVRMTEAVEIWLKDVDEAKGDTGPGTASPKARHLKENMKIIVPRQRHASLGWLTSCLAIDAILRHGFPRDMSHDAVLSVLSKMRWYISLPNPQPTEQESPEEPLDIPKERANAFKDKILALYKAVLHFQILIACSSAGNGPLPPQGNSPEDVAYISHRHQVYRAKEDILRRERALAVGINGPKIEHQLRRFLESKTVLKVHKKSEIKHTDQLLEKLQVTHRPIPRPHIDDGHFNPWRFHTRRFQFEFTHWATSTPEYSDWVSDTSNSRVLWVTGDAGSGKTALLQALVWHLRDQTVYSERTVAYFFCDNTMESEGGSFAMIVRSLIWQILKDQPSLISLLERKLSSTKEISLGHSNDFYAVSTLLYTLVRGRDTRTIYFVVDGIEDLCVEPSDVNPHLNSVPRDPYGVKWGLEDMLRLIATTSQLSGRVRWLVSSKDARMKIIAERCLDTDIILSPEDSSDMPTDGDRDGPSASDHTDTSESEASDVENEEASGEKLDVGTFENNTQNLKTTRAKMVYISTTENSVRPILETYIASKVRALARNTRYGGKLQDQIREKLQARSSGNLLWINIACYAVESHGISWDAPSFIDSLSLGVPHLYAQMLERLRDFGEDNREHCEVVLGTVAIAFRPLTIPELEDIVYAPVEDIAHLPEEVDLRTLIGRMCSPFLEVLENKVMFKHSAARDYLRKYIKERQKLSQTHNDMIRRCLRTASSNNRWSNMSEGLKSNRYGSVFWFRHLSELEFPYAVAVLELVNDFLKGHFLGWVGRLVSEHLVGQAREHLQLASGVLKEKARREGISDIHILLRYIRASITFLNFHLSLRGPEGLSLQNSLLFYPRRNELEELVPLEELSFDSAIRPFSREADPCLFELKGHEARVQHCAYSPSGRLLASVSNDGAVRLWDAYTGRCQHKLKFAGNVRYVHRVAFSPEHRGLLAIADDNSDIKLWHVPTGTHLKTLETQPRGRNNSGLYYVKDIVFSPDGNRLIAYIGGRVVKWQLPSYQWEQLADFVAEGSRYNDCARFSSDGRLLAWTVRIPGDHKYHIGVWDVDDYELCHRLEGHDWPVGDMAFSSDSALLATGSQDGTVRIWSVKTGQMSQVLGTGGWVMSVTFSSDGLRLAYGLDATVQIWKATASVLDITTIDTRAFKPDVVLRGHDSLVTAVHFSPGDHHLSSASIDGTLRIWSVDNIGYDVAGRKDMDQQLPSGHRRPISFITLSTNGTMVASASFDGVILLWDANRGTLLRELAGGHKHEVNSLAFSQDGNLIVSASIDTTVGLWDTGSGEMLCELQGHSRWVLQAVISPNDRFVASVSADGTARVWDIEPILESVGETKVVGKVKDGDRGLNSQIIPWVLLGHNDHVFCAAFSPDSRYLATGGDNDQILIWDLEAGGGGNDSKESDNMEDYRGKIKGVGAIKKPCATLTDIDMLTDYVRGLVFVPPDGKTLVSVTKYGSVHIWKAQAESKKHWDWQCMRVIKAEELAWDCRKFQHLRIDADDPDVLLSEYGAVLQLSSLDVLNSSIAPPEWCRYGIREENEDGVTRPWITRDNEKLIFLPESYRPNRGVPCSCRVQGSRVVIGCGSGEVLIFTFK